MSSNQQGPTPSSWEVTFRAIEGGAVELKLPDVLVENLRLRPGQKVQIWARDGKIFIEPQPRFQNAFGRTPPR